MVDEIPVTVGSNATVILDKIFLYKGELTMNIAERIQKLRKSKNLSQEELANKIGVSRQAVSKWESEQSVPDLDKIITLSEFFNTSTDYLLKGKEHNDSDSNEMLSKGLYIVATFIIFFGLFSGITNWNENPILSEVGGAILIQSAGVVIYFISNIFSSFQVSIYLKLINIMFILFMPISIATGSILNGEVAPYPTYGIYIITFLFVFLILSLVSYYLLLKANKRKY